MRVHCVRAIHPSTSIIVKTISRRRFRACMRNMVRNTKHFVVNLCACVCTYHKFWHICCCWCIKLFSQELALLARLLSVVESVLVCDGNDIWFDDMVDGLNGIALLACCKKSVSILKTTVWLFSCCSKSVVIGTTFCCCSVFFFLSFFLRIFSSWIFVSNVIFLLLFDIALRNRCLSDRRFYLFDS